MEKSLPLKELGEREEREATASLDVKRLVLGLPQVLGLLVEMTERGVMGPLPWVSQVQMWGEVTTESLDVILPV